MNLNSTNRGRNTLRIIFGAIILITLPFYCLGIILWGTAPARGVVNRTLTPGATATLVLTEPPFVVTITPPTLQVQPTQPTFPTVGGGGNIPPTAYFPPVVTAFATPTIFIFPTSTIAPTLTPFPTLTQVPPTNTLIPQPTNTFTWTWTWTHTWTPTPTPTASPTLDFTPIPFDSPMPP